MISVDSSEQYYIEQIYSLCLYVLKGKEITIYDEGGKSLHTNFLIMNRKG